MLIGWFLVALPVWAVTWHFLALGERRRGAGLVGLTLALLGVAVVLAAVRHDTRSDDPLERFGAEVQALMLVTGAAVLADLLAIGWWLAFMVRRS